MNLSYISCHSVLDLKAHSGVVYDGRISHNPVQHVARGVVFTMLLSVAKSCCLLQLIKLDSQLHLINRLFTSIRFHVPELPETWEPWIRATRGDEKERWGTASHWSLSAAYTARVVPRDSSVADKHNARAHTHTHHGAVFHTGPHKDYWHFFFFSPPSIITAGWVAVSCRDVCSRIRPRTSFNRLVWTLLPLAGRICVDVRADVWTWLG